MSHLASEDFSDVTPEDQYPKTINLCSSIQWRQNWKCLLLTLSICFCLVSIIYNHNQFSNQIAVSQDHVPNRNICWALIFFAVILYALYLMECSYAADKMLLHSHKSYNIGRVKEKIEQMRNSDPIIWWKATCYHFIRRKRRTARYNRRGAYFVSTKVYQERVNSFSSSSKFNYSCCGVSDISNALVLDGYCKPIVKFSFSKGFAFANMASAIEFEEQRSMFFRELRRYDDFMDIHEGLDLTNYPTFEEKLVAINTSDGRTPWFANPFYYWLCSCCLLSWPFRMILLHNTVYVRFKVTKLFGTNYNNLTESRQQLALLQFYGSYSMLGSGERDDTPTTDWLDTDSRTNVDQQTTLVPSYSEALLLLEQDQDLLLTTNEQNASTTRISSSSSTETLHKEADHLINKPNAADINLIPPSPLFRNLMLPSRSPHLPRKPHRRGNIDSNRMEQEVVQISADDNESSDGPPSYEEALMFPVIEQQRPLISSNVQLTAENSILAIANSSAQLGNQTQLSNEIRLPNSSCRTFLSIETSL